MGVQGIDTQTQLSRPLLLSCRIRLPCMGKVYTRASWTRGPTRLLPNHLRLPQNKNLDSVHLYWQVSLLLTPGGLLPAARQMPDTNCSITNQLLADWSRKRASCAQSRRSTRRQTAADCGSGKTAGQTCQPPSKWDWRWPSLCRLDLERTGSVGEPLTDCAQGWAVRKQWWGDVAISTTPRRWIGSHGRWPTSSPVCRAYDV